MIIIAVLGVLGIMLIMNLQLCSDTLYAEKYLSRLQKREASYYIARSIFKASVKLLENDQSMNKVDSLQDMWALGPFVYEIDEGKITLKIEDENRFFDINSIVDKDGNVEEKHVKELKKLLTILEINENFAGAIVDWIDSDTTATTPGGSETLKDSNLPCKNAPFDSIDELFNLNFFDETWFSGGIAHGEYKLGLKDVLTAHSNGKVNINTAGLEVLQSLDSELSYQSAQEIINRRKDKPFESMDDLLEVPGFNSDLIYRIKYLSDVVSSHFRITIEVDKEGDRTILTAIVSRESGSSQCLYWKVE
jgi:general secretion pathway protein K